MDYSLLSLPVTIAFSFPSFNLDSHDLTLISFLTGISIAGPPSPRDRYFLKVKALADY